MFRINNFEITQISLIFVKTPKSPKFFKIFDKTNRGMSHHFMIRIFLIFKYIEHCVNSEQTSKDHIKNQLYVAGLQTLRVIQKLGFHSC